MILINNINSLHDYNIMDMFVTKRNGQTEELSYDKIIQRLKQLFPNSTIQYSGLVLKIIDQLYNHIQS